MDFTHVISSEELKVVEELKQRIKSFLPKDIYEDSYTIYRFLKARDFDLDQAELLLQKYLEYKKIYEMDTILTDYEAPEVLKKYIVRDFIGYDKENNLVTFWSNGNMDLRDVLKSTNKFDLLKYSIKIMEENIQQQKMYYEKTGKLSRQVMYICDVANFNFSTVKDMNSIEFFKSEITMILECYPEMLKALVVINAPAFFAWVLPIFKVVFTGTFSEKLHVFGKVGWKEALLNMIDEEVLPVCLGGKRTDPDGNPLCKTLLTIPEPVKEKYFVTKSVQNFAVKPGVRKQYICKNSSYSVEIEVPCPGSIFMWEFLTAAHDIGFKIIRKDGNRNTQDCEILLPLHRYATERNPMNGKISCSKKGLYIMIFDNTHSRFFSKEIYYVYWIKNPEAK